MNCTESRQQSRDVTLQLDMCKACGHACASDSAEFRVGRVPILVAGISKPRKMINLLDTVQSCAVPLVGHSSDTPPKMHRYAEPVLLLQHLRLHFKILYHRVVFTE